MEQTTIGGTYGKDIKLDENAGKDPWYDAPRFVAGLEEGKSEFLLSLPVDQPMIGEYRGVKEAKSSTKNKRRCWARFVDLGGNRYSIQTTSQLEGILTKQYNIGQTVRITYKGKEYVEQLQQECHQWEVIEVINDKKVQ